MKVDFCKNIESCKVSKNQKKETLKDPVSASDSVCFIENSTSYIKIEFENCVYKDVQTSFKKCDFGIETENEIYYIELKGQDENEGMRQLLATINVTKHCFNKKKINGILVVSKKQTPKNLDKKLYSNLSKTIGRLPVIEQKNYKLVI